MVENTIAAFQAYPLLFYVVIAFIGMSTGSFLNVVVYRLPLIMEQNWKIDVPRATFVGPDDP